tara:strand:+ start:5511 stop:5978 length:468 start_codon:yes stop_codon:yes gene_type:complete
MNYKDKTLEINDIQIRFSNNIFILLIIFFSIFTTSLTFGKGSILSSIFSLIGLLIGFLLIRLYIGIYFKNTIELSNIDFVKAQNWDRNIDKEKNFWGVCVNKYHFPTGLNKKTNPKVILIHLKERKSAIGFVPENYENAISVLKNKGIKIIEKPF